VIILVFFLTAKNELNKSRGAPTLIQHNRLKHKCQNYQYTNPNIKRALVLI